MWVYITGFPWESQPLVLAFPEVAAAALKEGIRLGMDKDLNFDNEAGMQNTLFTRAQEDKKSHAATSLQGLALQLAARREIPANYMLKLEIRLVRLQHTHQTHACSHIACSKPFAGA